MRSILLLGIIFFANSGISQESDKNFVQKYMHDFHLGIGLQYGTSLQDYNLFLESNNISSLNDFALQGGVGTRFKFGQHYIGASFFVFSYANNALADNFRISHQCNQLSLSYSYDLLKNKENMTFELGLGVGGMRMDLIARPGDSTITLNEFTNGVTNTLYENPTPVVVLTPFISMNFPIIKRKTTWLFVLFGYNYSFGRFGWNEINLPLDKHDAITSEVGLRWKFGSIFGSD